MDREREFEKQSGAPEAGGATTRHSVWGGTDPIARLWRFLARVSRQLEATAYRRLKELEARRDKSKAHHPGNDMEPGAPKRTKEAARVGKPEPQT